MRPSAVASLLSGASLISLLLAAGGARATEEAPSPALDALRDRGEASAPAAPGPVMRLSMALRLFALAEASGDPLDMALAQRLARGINLRQARHWHRDDLPAANAAAKEAEGDSALAPEASQDVMALDLLRDQSFEESIAILAREDETLSDILASLPAVTATGSALRADAVITAGGLQQWRVAFDGKRPAEAAVFPAAKDAGEGLVWWLEDSYDLVICPQKAAAEQQSCRFTPAQNDFYRVVVRNRGEAAQSYALVTN